MAVEKSETIFIIGFGAIGKALAVFLQLAGNDVKIIRGSVDAGEDETRELHVLATDGTRTSAQVHVTTLSKLRKLDGIVVLANKSFGNNQLAHALKEKIGSTPIVLLQNGLGVEQPFMNQYFAEVYRCVLFVTAQNLDETNVRFKPVSVCPVGVEKGTLTRLAEVVKKITTPAFEFSVQENIQEIIWKKAIANCVFNSICPLLEIDNGIFHKNERALEIARTVIEECIVVARAKGIILESEEVEQTVLQISRASDGQLISTLQDIRNGRPTEIDTLNLEVARIAEQLGLKGAAIRTKLLGELVRLKAG